MKPVAATTADAKASPSASATEALAVGKRFKISPSFSTLASNTISAASPIGEFRLPIIAITLDSNPLIVGKSRTISSELPLLDKTMVTSPGL